MIATLHRARQALRDLISPAGWCLRLDWPDHTHQLVCFRTRRVAAERDRAFLCQRYWPLVAPATDTPACTVVPISQRDWQSHAQRERCTDLTCPTGNERDPHAHSTTSQADTHEQEDPR